MDELGGELGRVDSAVTVFVAMKRRARARLSSGESLLPYLLRR